MHRVVEVQRNSMKMSNKSPGNSAPQRCRLILKQCLAIQLSKPGHVPEDFWMYDSGYMIFQNFLAANAQCWWNAPLTAATRALKYAGHVAPGMLLVTAEPCALEVLRGAYARSVLKPPATYVISSVGDIDDCIVAPTVQGQFTPLPEALCDIIMDLTAQGQSATIENIRVKLSIRFPHMQPPTAEITYDSLAQLMQERKIYQTAKGYFIVTPERRRSRSRPRNNHHNNQHNHHSFEEHYDEMEGPAESRIMLMTNAEAVNSLYGEISTERDGDLTHQCIQTNLADVICGGNPNDKIIYARSSKRRSASFPTPRSLERRHSLRLFGSSKRLQRCASTRSLSKNYAQTLNTDSSSSEYQSTDSSSPKKVSLLSRLFRRSGRSKQRQIETFSGQFPPAEWFNSKAVHLHSIGTQTTDHDVPVAHTLSNSTFYDGSELSQRSLTLPRRHHRRHLSSESTFVISSRDCSPIRRGSPVYCSSSLPRSTHSIPAVPTHQIPSTGNGDQSKTQRTIPSKHLLNEQNRMAAAKSSEIYRSPNRKSVSTGSAYENKISADRQQRQYHQYHNQQQHLAQINSGPSSYDSGKTSSMMTTTSGPSSLESGKTMYSRSDYSSVDLNSSLGGGTTTNSHHHSPSRSVGSPPKHYLAKSKLANDNINRVKSSSTNSSPIRRKPSTTTADGNLLGKPPRPQAGSLLAPSQNSNSSITLQVTTSNESHIPSTKIYVQNSPVRSVITLENGKLTENSNVVIINNETTTNANGDLIKRTITKQGSPTRVVTKWDKDQQQQSSYSETEAAYETGDSLSLISETSPDSSLCMTTIDGGNGCRGGGGGGGSSGGCDTPDLLENNKFNKNINNDATMNNSRKLSLQIAHPANNIVYKNCLKDNTSMGDHTTSTTTTTSMPASPVKPNNYFDVDSPASAAATPNGSGSHHNNHDSFYDRIAGSVGNLRFFEKNEKKLYSNCDLNQLPFESPALLAKLNSNPAINTDSLAHILHKNIITVGSEPNLAIKMIECNNISKLNGMMAADHKAIDKEPMDRRFSVSTTCNSAKDHAASDDVYNFPSLTDLSFNFTSLAAQKILQGCSINSIDTLVELNMAQQEKQQNLPTATVGGSTTTTAAAVVAPAIRTDYGMV